MKKLIVPFIALGFFCAYNNSSKTKRTDDATSVVDKMGHTVDTAGLTNPADTATGVSDMDRDFIMKVAITNTAEVQLGQIATTKGGSDAVKNYGDLMVREHTEAQNRIKAIASSLSLPAPDSVDEKNKSLKEKLNKLSGRSEERRVGKESR